MKNILLVLTAILIYTTTFSQENENYILIINNDSLKINLNENYKYKTSFGKELTLKVVQPTILSYSDEMISFNYSNKQSISNTEIADGIEQLMAINANGNGFMVQKYSRMNPTSLVQLMLSEIVKESINYGYTKKEEPFKKTLKTGETIDGIQATLTYKGEQSIYTVASYGAKDEGIIVITMMLNTEFGDKRMIDLFWDTFKIK